VPPLAATPGHRRRPEAVPRGFITGGAAAQSVGNHDSGGGGGGGGTSEGIGILAAPQPAESPEPAPPKQHALDDVDDALPGFEPFARAAAADMAWGAPLADANPGGVTLSPPSPSPFLPPPLSDGGGDGGGGFFAAAHVGFLPASPGRGAPAAAMSPPGGELPPSPQFEDAEDLDDARSFVSSASFASAASKQSRVSSVSSVFIPPMPSSPPYCDGTAPARANGVVITSHQSPVKVTTRHFESLNDSRGGGGNDGGKSAASLLSSSTSKIGKMVHSAPGRNLASPRGSAGIHVRSVRVVQSGSDRDISLVHGGGASKKLLFHDAVTTHSPHANNKTAAAAAAKTTASPRTPRTSRTTMTAIAPATAPAAQRRTPASVPAPGRRESEGFQAARFAWWGCTS
jgi:hypothetical protein